MEPPGHQGKPEPCSYKRELSPGYPYFSGPSGAKRTAMGYVVLAQIRPPYTTLIHPVKGHFLLRTPHRGEPGPLKESQESSKTSPEEARTQDRGQPCCFGTPGRCC